MGLAGAGIAHEQDVLLDIEILAAHQFEDQGLVDARLRREVKGVQGFTRRFKFSGLHDSIYIKP